MFLVTFKLALINALYQVNFAVSIRQLQIYLTLQHHYDGVSTYYLPNNTNEKCMLHYSPTIDWNASGKNNIAQKDKVFHYGFFQQMWPNTQETADLVTQEILHGKLHFFELLLKI